MDEAMLFLVVCSDRTKSNGLKLEHWRFCINMRKLISGKGDKALEEVTQRDCGVSF